MYLGFKEEDELRRKYKEMGIYKIWVNKIHNFLFCFVWTRFSLELSNLICTILSTGNTMNTTHVLINCCKQFNPSCSCVWERVKSIFYTQREIEYLASI